MILALDILQDIFQYIQPRCLHGLAESSPWLRYIVNGMDRAEYIERWIGRYGYNTSRLVKDGYYHKTYPYLDNPIVYEDLSKYDIIQKKTNIKYALLNYWYFNLVFDDDTYLLMLDVITLIPNKTLAMHIKSEHIQNIDLNKKGLGSIHSITLNYCPQITDLTNLEYLHYINIHSCHNIQNIDALAHTHTVIVDICEGIYDISKLGGLYSLTVQRPNIAMYHHQAIIGLDKVGGLHTLYLSQIYSVKDICNLAGVHTLGLSSCYNISDVGSLGGVNALDIIGCVCINDINTLGGLHELILTDCKRIVDIHTLGGLHTLWLHDTNIVDHSDILGVSNIYNCNYNYNND